MSTPLDPSILKPFVDQAFANKNQLVEKFGIKHASTASVNGSGSWSTVSWYVNVWADDPRADPYELLEAINSLQHEIEQLSHFDVTVMLDTPNIAERKSA